MLTLAVPETVFYVNKFIFILGGYVDQSALYGAQAAPAASAGKNQDSRSL